MSWWGVLRATLKAAATTVIFALGAVVAAPVVVPTLIVCTAVVFSVVLVSELTDEFTPRPHSCPPPPENKPMDIPGNSSVNIPENPSCDSLLCVLDFLYADQNDACCSKYLQNEKMIKARRTKSCQTTIEKCHENRLNKLTPLFLKECQKCVELLNEGCECTTILLNCKNDPTQHPSKTSGKRKKCCEYCSKFFKPDNNRPWRFCAWQRCVNDFIFYERNMLCCAQHFPKDKFSKNVEERSCLTDSAGCVGRDTYGPWMHEKRCIECTKMLGGACDCFGTYKQCQETRGTTREVEQTKIEVCCKYCLQKFTVTRDYVCSDIVCSCEDIKISNKLQDLCWHCEARFPHMMCKPTDESSISFSEEEWKTENIQPGINKVSIVKATSYLKPNRKVLFILTEREGTERQSTTSSACSCELYNFGHMEPHCNDLCTLFRMALRWWMNIVMPRSWVRSRAVATLDTDSKEPSNASNSTASSISICLRLSIAHREQPSFQKCVRTCHELFSRTRNSYSTMFNPSCKTERGINQAFCSWCWYNLGSDHGAEPSKYHRTNYSSETTQLYVLILHSTHAFLTLLLFAAFCAKANYTVICLSILKVLIIFLCILSIGYAYGRFVFGPEHCLQVVEGFALSMGTIVAVLWLGEELEGGTRITRTAAVLA